MDIKLYAAILLIARLISMAFVSSVIYKQLNLFKLPIELESEMTVLQRKNLRSFRIVLFLLALSFFLLNIIPAVIDAATVFGDLDRAVRTVMPVSLVYTMTWAGGSLIMAILIWLLYYLSKIVDNKPQIAMESSDHTLMNNKDNIQGDTSGL